MSEVQEYAPAKLTWSLRVLGPRPDGYHEIDALATTISEPRDRVVLRARPTTTLVVAGSTRDVPIDATNLAVQAADAAGATVAIELTKQIPAGGGLGGGSSDAGAVLRALSRDLGLDAGRAREIARRLGSDVAMCLEGGTAWMSGRGELLQPVEPLASVPVVVVVPPIHSSTPAVYRAWDELGGPRGTRTLPAPPALERLVTELVNDLEPAAERVEPKLAQFRRDLGPVMGQELLLAGSGSAYAAWFDDPDEARTARERVARDLGVSAFVGIAG